jgi:hypothetical protein
MCRSGRWLNTMDSVNTDHSDRTKMEYWRNGNVMHSVNRLLFTPSILLRSSTPWLRSLSETLSWYWWEDISTIPVQLQVTLVELQMTAAAVQSLISLYQVVRVIAWNSKNMLLFRTTQLYVIRHILWKTTLYSLIWIDTSEGAIPADWTAIF